MKIPFKSSIVPVLVLTMLIISAPFLGHATLTWRSVSTAGMGESADNNWLSVVWGAGAPNGSGGTGLFVAIAYSGTGNRVMTSPDGVNWQARATPADNSWASVTWSPALGLFVAVASSGAGNRVMTSPDGVNWTLRASAADNFWQSVTWSATLNLFVAVGNSGTGNRVMTSPDGIAWTSRTSAADNGWTSVTFSASLSLFVAVANTGSGNRVMTSSDGITWTSRTSASDNNWVSVSWSPDVNLFVAVSATGTGNRVMTSPDGVTWTSRVSAADNNWRSVTWAAGAGVFVAVANTGIGNRVMTSPDGITWTIRISAADIGWVSVCWAPSISLLVAVSNNGTGNRIMTSSDGITWTSRNSYFKLDNNWSSICWSPSLQLFVAVSNGTGNSGHSIMTSADGFSWTLDSVPGTNYWWTSVAWSPVLGLFVAVSDSSLATGLHDRVVTSADGINWTTRGTADENQWMSVTWASGIDLFAAVARGTAGTGQQVMTSADGVNWTARTAATPNQWQSIAWSPSLSLFVAVASSGTGNRVMTSPDGISWTMRSSAADNNWQSVTWSQGLGLFVAVAGSGSGNRVMTSPDGIAWTARASAGNYNWTSVTWSPEAGIFAAVAADTSLVMTSADGITWSTMTCPDNNSWSAVTWSDERGSFAAVGQSGFGKRSMISGSALPYLVSYGTPGDTVATITWTTDAPSTSTVNYGLTAAYGHTTTNSTLVTNHSVTITGLSCNTVYHFSVASTDSLLTSVSPDASFTTAICFNGPTVMLAPVSGITQNSASLSGSITATGITNASVIGFHWGLTSGYGHDTATFGSFGVGAFTTVLSGLTCNTNYHAQAYAINTGGIGTSMPDRIFTTSPCVPGPPAGLGVIRGATQATLFWTVPASNGGAAISDYLVEYKPIASTSWATFAHAPTYVTTMTITGLSSTTDYVMRVSAVNSAGTSMPTDTVHALAASADFFHVLSTGQSLAVGFNAFPAVSTTQPYNNLSLSPGPTGTTGPLIPLYENWLETPSSGIANSLRAADTLGRPIVVGDHALGGQPYYAIKKGGTLGAYANGMLQAATTKSLVESGIGGVYKPLAVTIIHGESDAALNVSSDTYAAYMQQMQSDYEVDLDTLTGSASLIPLFESQMNTNSIGEIPCGQLAAHINNPGKVILIGPKYQCSYDSDHVHITPVASKNLGEMYAKVIRKVMFEGQTWDPLMPTTVLCAGNIVTISYHIPVGHLVIDTINVTPRPAYGFEFTQTGGSAISIVSVSLISSQTQVRIVLSGIPDGLNPKIRYAWTYYDHPGSFSFTDGGGATNSTKVGGNIRDMDSSVSTAIGSTGLPLYDWGVTFNQPIVVTPALVVGDSLPAGVTQTSALLKGNIITTGGFNASVRGFKWGATSAYGSVLSTSGSYGAGAYSILLSGLSCNTTYHYEAFAVNGTGTANSTTDEVFSTLPCTPAVGTSPATSVSGTTASAGGNVSSTGGSITARGIYYGPTTSYGDTIRETGSFGTGAFTEPLSGLTCGNTYHYAAFASNAGGTDVGSDATFTTAASTPAGTINGADGLCKGTTTSFSDTVTGGVWSVASGVATVGSTGTVTGNAISSDIVSYTVTNSYGCTTVATRSFNIEGTPGDLYTFAGTGTNSSTGNGGPAYLATMQGPRGITSDTAGNLYFCDVTTNVIRRVSPTGIVSLFAGNGGTGNGGDGGPATAATLSNAMGVYADKQGNVFVSNTNSHTIRKINAAGVISTVAGVAGVYGSSGDGGPAAAAKLNSPLGITGDAAGNLYVADQSNYRVRRIDGATGTITTVAGTGSNYFSGDGGPGTAARLSGIRAVCTDYCNNLYIADGPNFAVRKLSLSTGVITTIAGTGGLSGSSGDGGPASAAKLFSPCGIAFDGGKLLYEIDLQNNKVRQIDIFSGTITTAAGSGSGAFGGDGGAGTSASLYQPYGINCGIMNNVYITDAANRRIRVFASKGSIGITLAGPATVAPGASVTFTAHASTTFDVSYQWQKNGINTGGGLSSFTDTSPTNGDVYQCVLEVLPDCGSPYYDTSNSITIWVAAARTADTSKPVTGIANPVAPTGLNHAAYLYPNPAHTGVTIVAGPTEEAEAGIVFTDVMGRQVYSGSFSMDNQRMVATINIQQIPAGVYIVLITYPSGRTERLRCVKE